MSKKLTLPTISLEQVTAIQQILAESWGIKSPQNPAEWTARIESLPQDIKGQYQELLNAQLRYTEKGKAIPADIERRWYDLLGVQPLSGIVHSRKYPFILDSAAAVIDIYRQCGLSGPILDIGCHVGYHLDIYDRLLDTEVIGIEVSATAVATAKAHFVSRPRVTVIQGDIEKIQIPECKLISCVDAYPTNQAGLTAFLARIAKGLPGDGVVVLIGGIGSMKRGEVAKACKHIGLGMALHDVIGGWVGDLGQYQGNAVLALRRDGESVPKDLHMEWTEGFPEYANNPSTPWHEKTQAFFRSRHI
jgi:hypothetical protein